MWSTQKQPPSLEETLQAVIGRRPTQLKKRIRDASQEFTKNSQTLQNYSSKSDVRSLSADLIQSNHFTSSEYRSFYSNSLQKKSNTLRQKMLANGPFQGRCFYCCAVPATTLDHFVCQYLYPELSVTPWNLIACCGSCNTKKGTHHPRVAEEEFFLPWDMHPLARWLFASFDMKKGPQWEFFVGGQNLSNLLETQRVEFLFNKLDLNAVYTVAVAKEFATLCKKLERLYSGFPPSVIKEFLIEEAAVAFDVDANSYSGALFEALSQDAAFCDGGFAKALS